MRIRRWLYEVFIGAGAFRAAYFWILIVLWMIGAIIIRLTPWGAENWSSHWPIWSVYLPAGGLLIGFVICNVAAFNRACDRADAAEQQLRGLSIDLQSVTAGEHVYPEDIGAAKAHHFIVIALPLVVRNHDGGHDSSIEVVSCTTDLRAAPCDRVLLNTHYLQKLSRAEHPLSGNLCWGYPPSNGNRSLRVSDLANTSARHGGNRGAGTEGQPQDAINGSVFDYHHKEPGPRQSRRGTKHS